jgi:hypothetical protein
MTGPNRSMRVMLSTFGEKILRNIGSLEMPFPYPSTLLISSWISLRTSTKSVKTLPSWSKNSADSSLSL